MKTTRQATRSFAYCVALYLALCLALCLMAPAARAQGPMAAASTPARQDGEALRSLVLQFLQVQASTLAAQVGVQVGPVDARMNLPACAAPQAFMAPGARAWGRTSVGVRCAGERGAGWTVYLQAQVSVQGDYVAAATALPAGQTIDASQLLSVHGDIAALPAGIVSNMAQAVGHTLAMPAAAGMPLRLDALRSKPVVQTGQLVQLVSGGAGFKVSAEAHAIGSAGDGQVVQVRTRNGAIVSGVAKAGGLVEVVF